MTFRLACLQMNSGNDIAANIDMFNEMVAEAAGRGARLIASPENTFLMEPSYAKASEGRQPKAERVLYTQIEHPGVQAAIAMARHHKVWLLIGSVHVKTDESGKTLNRSLLLNPAGEIAAHYDKIHLFDVEVGDGQVYKESARILPGGKAVVASINTSPLRGEVAARSDAGGGDNLKKSTPSRPPATLSPSGGGEIKMGMSICYDVRFPQLYRKMAKQGAQMLAVPAAFTQVTGEAHWHVLLRARAIENGCFVIAPAQCGTHPGKRKTFGHSLIIDPWGRVLADAGVEPGIITAEIDFEQVKKVRAQIPSLLHDREFK